MGSCKGKYTTTLYVSDLLKITCGQNLLATTKMVENTGYQLYWPSGPLIQSTDSACRDGIVKVEVVNGDSIVKWATLTNKNNTFPKHHCCLQTSATSCEDVNLRWSHVHERVSWPQHLGLWLYQKRKVKKQYKERIWQYQRFSYSNQINEATVECFVAVARFCVNRSLLGQSATHRLRRKLQR